MYQNSVSPEGDTKDPKTGDKANRKNLKSKKVPRKLKGQT